MKLKILGENIGENRDVDKNFNFFCSLTLDNIDNSMIEEIVVFPDRQEAYHRLVSLFMNGTEGEREKIRKGWDFCVDWIFPNPRRLACVINEKYSCRQKILALLVYEAIEDFRKEEFRDKIVTLAVIYNSCLSAKIDPAEVFEEVASVSSAKTANLLRDFIKRNGENKSLEAFLLTRVINGDGEVEIFPSWMNQTI